MYMVEASKSVNGSSDVKEIHAANPAYKFPIIFATAILISILCLISIVGCASGNAVSTDDSEQTTMNESETVETEEQKLDREVQAIIEAMTLEQKVDQLFFITPEALTNVDTVVQAGSSTEEALRNHPVGGLIYFAQNLTDPDQTRTMLKNTQTFAQNANGLPLFLAVDEEGGTVSRVGGNPGFPIDNVGDMAKVGATGDVAYAKDVAITIGNYLHDLDFNTDLAPVADIGTNPNGSMMRRSFGQTPDLVASMVRVQVEGFLSSDILCAVKHFPGIGGVAGDPHTGEIVSDKTLDEIKAEELVPFEAAIDAGVPFVMMGHLLTPAATTDNLPATLSPTWINGVLREQLGFQGIVVSDSLSMGAVSNIATNDRIGVEVVNAGVDMILMPEDFTACYRGLLDAVNSGEIATDRIDESLKRILKVKLNYLATK